MFDEKRLIVIENFDMPQLDRKRTIRIYLPKNYSLENKNYPVLYMHDAQNLFYPNMSFSGHTWEICENLDLIETQGLTEGIILVAIDNSNLRNGVGRLDEYSPWVRNFMNGIPKDWRGEEDFGGEGDKYSDFIVNSLKEYVDNNFRTKKEKEFTFIGGSSMGALISLYIGTKYKDKFSKLLLVSPAFWFAYEDLLKYLIETHKNDLFVYMDMGTEETSDSTNPEFPKVYLDSVYGVEKVLKDKVKELIFKVYEGHNHSEKAWASRIYEILRTMVEEK